LRPYNTAAVEGDPWGMFRGAVEAYSAHRKANIRASKIVVGDESMSAYQPRSTKLGELPNISCIKRKPKPLGTELKTTACATTGAWVHFVSFSFPDCLIVS
jgi:hypothetical protein